MRTLILRTSFWFLLFFVLIFCGCSEQMKKTELVLVRNDGTTETLSVELALTPEEQAHGYMERKKIPAGTGMLFVFQYDQRASFWMKNTPTPLSIAYIDSTGTIRDIFNMKPFSLEAINSTVSVRYALEVPQGWFAENNITPGDKIQIPKL
ncbi:MAG: DUF192 domain-containing protein [Spirochaetaceae bacterium]|nr:DUF192 domain-containing protein [Spirochaetaceae bacterium]